MPTFNHSARALPGAIALAAVLTACSGTEEESPSVPGPTEATSNVAPSTALTPSGSESDTTEPTRLGPLLTVTIAGDDVQPNAEELDLSTGEKLLIEIESDRAGELHVHSTPEQFIEFAAGTTNSELVIETPGSVEVEDHDTGAVVALIEVR